MLVTLNANMLIKSPGLTMEVKEIYKALTEVFKGEEPLLVQRMINGNNYCWNIAVRPGESWRRLGEASASEAEAVAAVMDAYRRKVSAHFGLAEEQLEAIFTTPDDNNFIFFSVVNGKLRVAIAAWGFAYKSGFIAGDLKNISLKDGGIHKRKQVNIGFSDHGRLNAGVTFTLGLPSGLSKTFTTASDGLSRLGEFVVGMELSIALMTEGRRFDCVVSDEVSDYIFDISRADDGNDMTNDPEKARSEKNPKTDLPDKEPEKPRTPEKPRRSEKPEKPENPKRTKKKAGKPVKNAPKPFVPDPGDIVYDPGRKCKIYGNSIFAIIDKASSKSKNPMADFCRQFTRAYPVSQIASLDEFCNMVMIVVDAAERNKILSELSSKIKDVAFYADAVTVFTESLNAFNYGDGETWHLRAIGAEMAHQQTKGDKKIKVAVIDTYFELDHPAFRNMRVESAFSLEDGTDNVYPPDPAVDSHGTHVMGLIGASYDGFTGVSPDCTFIPISVGRTANTVSLLQGVLYALNKGATVINVSMGMDIPPEEAQKLSLGEQIRWWKEHARGMESAWDYVYGMLDRGYCTIVWSAGNDNLLELMDSSKRNDNIIRVDAVDPNLRKASFSNFGNVDKFVDSKQVCLQKSVISAPGVQVFSCVPGHGWEYKSGTSMAAPIVTGAVALIKSLDSTLTNREIIKLIKETSLPLKDSSIGPLLRIDRALDAISDSRSRWEDFKKNPVAGIGIWKKVDQTTYVDTETKDFKYYGQNYLIFESRTSGIIEAHEIGRDCIFNARFTASWRTDEIIIDIIAPFASDTSPDVILTSKIRLYRDTDGSIGFEVLMPKHVSRSHLRHLISDDRTNTTKRKI